MKLPFYTIEQTPRCLPIWHTILEDLNDPPPPRIARALGVSTTTVYRWSRDDSAPRMACLALFWLTRWGVSQIDAKAANDAAMYFALARAYEQEAHQLRQRIQHLESIGHYGSANQPIMGISR